MHSPIIQGEIDTCAATVVGGGPRPRGGRGGAAWTRRDRLGPRAAAAPGRAMPFDGPCRRPPAARRHRRPAPRVAPEVLRTALHCSRRPRAAPSGALARAPPPPVVASSPPAPASSALRRHPCLHRAAAHASSAAE